MRPARSLGPCNIPRILGFVDKDAGPPWLVVPDLAEHGGGAVVMEVLDDFLFQSIVFMGFHLLGQGRAVKESIAEDGVVAGCAVPGVRLRTLGTMVAAVVTVEVPMVMCWSIITETCQRAGHILRNDCAVVFSKASPSFRIQVLSEPLSMGNVISVARHLQGLRFREQLRLAPCMPDLEFLVSIASSFYESRWDCAGSWQ